jgi:FkbM family methyltransferase
MTKPITYGRGSGYRRYRMLERFAGFVSKRLGARAARAAFTRVYEATLWLSTAGRGLSARLPGGERVRLAPGCRGTVWNEEEYTAFREVTAAGSIVLEAGANVGAYTVLFAQWVGPGGHVYAFEPVPAIAAALARQLRLNRVADRVTIVRSAVSGRDGSLSLVAPGLVGINRMALPGDEEDGRVTVPAITIDSFCRQHAVQPSVIKIDVEGAELDVLRGARHTLQASQPPHVFIEWHPTLWPRYGIAEDDLRRELAVQQLSAVPLRPTDDVWRVEGICARLIRTSG